MKFIILQENLKKGINFVERISAKSFTLPILNNVLLKTEKNFVSLSTTDLEIGINWWNLAKIEKEGKIAIPAKILSGLINLLPNEKLLLEKKDSYLVLEWKNNKTSIKGFDPEEFPIIPQIKEGESITLNIQNFCQSLKQVVDIPTLSTARPEISGVFFSFNRNFIKIAATDSFRLGEKTLFLETGLSNPFSLILPQKAAKEIINIFGEREGGLKISFSPNQIQFEASMADFVQPEIQLISRLIDGEYPNYEGILPKGFQTQIILQKNEVLNEIKAASLFSAKVNEVKFKIDSKKERTEILSQNPELGEYHSSLAGKINGEDLEISFNWRFLIDGLLNIRSSEVIFELNGQEGPGVLKPVGDTSYLYVLMPIKMS